MKFFVALLCCGFLLFQVSHAQNIENRKRLADRFMHPHLQSTVNRFSDNVEFNATFWTRKAQTTLKQLLEKRTNTNVAKNVILFLGDGMSIPTVAASRVYIGGEEAQLAFDKFPFTGLSKTYCVDKQVADSACSATAYLCGVKANYQTIGVSSAVQLDDCNAMNDTRGHVHSIAHWSQLKGKRTGLVTTARVTHASPAGVYAHTAERNWECDTDILENGADPKVCRDIAYQLVHGETGKNLNVILGGGRGEFLPKEITDEEKENGFRSDNRNLIKEWTDQKKKRAARHAYVWNKEQLFNVNSNTEYLLGLFESSHCPYNLDRNPRTDPSLAEMTEAAIKQLNKGDKGYFLFVEGARIDMGHHEAKARKAFDEVAEFSKAIQKAVDITDEKDTLIVVTSDHSHSMTYSGYPARHNDILGLSGLMDDENLPYLTINYANGPGFRKVGVDGERTNYANEKIDGKDFEFPGLFPLKAETHGGDDVGIFARGPWSHLFSGVMEQNVIPHAMAFASCVGDGATICSKNKNNWYWDN